MGAGQARELTGRVARIATCWWLLTGVAVSAQVRQEEQRALEALTDAANDRCEVLRSVLSEALFRPAQADQQILLATLRQMLGALRGLRDFEQLYLNELTVEYHGIIEELDRLRAALAAAQPLVVVAEREGVMAVIDRQVTLADQTQRSQPPRPGR